MADASAYDDVDVSSLPSIIKHGTIIEQFASEVTDFSSHYGRDSSISYTAKNIIGKPTVFPKYGDFPEAFGLRTYGQWWLISPSAPKFYSSPLPSGLYVRSSDFIEIIFGQTVYPLKIDIFEIYNPGAVVRILAYNCEKFRWEVLWSGSPQNVSPQSRIFSPPLKTPTFMSNLYRLELYHQHLDYYCQLDAVLLVGSVVPLHSQRNKLSALNGDYLYQNMETLSLYRPKYKLLKHQSYFDLLPDEVLHLIVSYLDLESLCMAAKVCRLFHKHCYDPVLYIELDLQPYWYKVTTSTIEGLQTRCSSLQRLNLSWCGGQKRLNFEIFTRFLSSTCRNLTSLKLSNCSFVNDEAMKTIADFCPNLQELELRSCQQRELGQLGFMQISRLTEMIRLDLYRTLIDRHSVITILRCCHKLEHLSLGGCHSINNHDEIATEICRNIRCLKSLDFWRARSLTADGISTIASHCPELLELDLSWCLEVDANSGCLRQLVHRCCKIRKLYLSAIRTISDADLLSMAAHLKDLEQLDILGTSEVSPEAISKVLSQCQNLKLLDVSFCGHVDFETVAYWREMFPHVVIKKSFQTASNFWMS